jgi:signal transduction histidine kinase
MSRIRILIADDHAVVRDGLALVIFHSVKELLMNAIKHAGASRVTISAEQQGDAIEVRVSDDGHGFDPRRRNERSGFGLFSIERRMACLNAQLDVQSTEQRGTSAVLRIPLKS